MRCTTSGETGESRKIDQGDQTALGQQTFLRLKGAQQTGQRLGHDAGHFGDFFPFKAHAYLNAVLPARAESPAQLQQDDSQPLPGILNVKESSCGRLIGLRC